MLRTAGIFFLLLAPVAATLGQDSSTGRRPGLAVHVYERGDRDGQAPSTSAVVASLEPGGQEALRGLRAMSLVRAGGYLTIDTAGHYDFELLGAAAGGLTIGDAAVISIAGAAEGQNRGGVALTPGEHPLHLHAVVAGGEQALTLRWKSPRMAAFGAVPAEALSFDQADLQRPKDVAKVGAERQEKAEAPVMHNVLSDAEKAQGWELLFDGRTMEKWRGFGREDVHEGWAVVDGAVTRVGGGGDIITREQYENFDLYLEWRIAPAGNSGVFYHVREVAENGERYSAVWQTGPEMQILDNQGHADRAQASTSAGANYALHAPIGDATRPVGAFNAARIVVRGDHVQYWLNGVKVVEFDRGSDDFKQLVARSKFATMPGFAKYRRGHIALQDHGDLVQFRNIKIRRLE
jgi:hypothetical protein